MTCSHCGAPSFGLVRDDEGRAACYACGRSAREPVPQAILETLATWERRGTRKRGLSHGIGKRKVML